MSRVACICVYEDVWGREFGTRLITPLCFYMVLVVTGLYSA